MDRFRMPPQVLRLVLLTLLIVASYITARHFLTPPTFGRFGHYRAGALAELSGRDPTFAGAKACDECHSDIGDKLTSNKHVGISCETCHGPARMHSKNPDLNPTKITTNICVRCHAADPARPSTQAQVVVQDHHHEKRCTECHAPHQPKTPL
jgi:predicted CXXCH cytochrome family protein